MAFLHRGHGLESPCHEDAAAFAATVQEPLVGIVDPGYLCGTRALGHFLPAGHPFFADTDRHLTEVYEKTLREPLVRCRRYGMMLYGQMVNGHTMWGGPPAGDLVYHLYKDTDPAKALRYVGPFNNESHDQALGVWGQFLRTGQRRDLRQAQVTTRAVADVSFVHADPGDPVNVGCIHYHGAHAWSNSLSRSHSEVGAIMTDYYLTGNRRLRDVAIEAAEGILYDKLEPCGIINCFSRLYREFTGPLSVLLDVYQATWHEKYGDPARRSLNWLLRTVRTPGWLPGSVYTRGPRGAEAVVEPELPPGEGATNTYHVFEPALRLFPSQTLREFLTGFAEYKCRAPVGNVSIANLCLAYEVTGDPEYAAAALAMVPRSGHKMEKTTDCASATLNARPDNDRIRGFYDFIACDLTPRLMKTVALAAEVDADFWAFARRWREDHAGQTPAKPISPPGQDGKVSLGVLSTEPHDNPLDTV